MPDAEIFSFFELLSASLKDWMNEPSRGFDSISLGAELPTLQVCFGSREIEARLGRSWKHLERVEESPIGFRHFMLDRKTAGFEFPRPPWELTDIGRQGVILGEDSGDYRATWQFGSEMLYLCDLKNQWGLGWAEDARNLPDWECSFPLRYPVSWLGETHPCSLTHAGAVGDESGAALIVGKSGSGKSTTSLSCLDHGMQFLGDDYVMTIAEPHPRVQALSSAIKISESRLSEFGFENLPNFPLGTDEPSDKRVVYLENYRPEQLVTSLPLKALIHPVITSENKPQFEPLSKAQMLSALAPSTIFQLPVDRNRIFDHLKSLVKALPCYEFRLSPSLPLNAELFELFLRDLPQPS